MGRPITMEERMPIAVITVDRINKHEASYLHFNDKSQKAWNCNVPELIQLVAVGERYKIDYNETAPKPGHKYGSKWINRMRLWQESDGDNTWPDKQPYTGGGGQQRSGGMKKDFDSETSKRQTAANVAGNIIANARQGGGLTMEDLDEVSMVFKATADVVHGWIDGPPKSDAGVAGGSGGGDTGGDIPF